MGITRQSGKFLAYAKKRGANFSNTLMLGRQELYLSASQFQQLLSERGINSESTHLRWEKYAEPLFHLLGADQVDSIDFSDYEKATIIHDLNNEIPPHLKSKYSLVFDGGTLEHVFNFPVAIRNCMSLLRIGGHFISVTPANNQLGHGFYQFSPELFYSLFTERSGFKLKSVMIGVEVNGQLDWEVFEVANPSAVKERVTVTNSAPTHLMIIAEKTHNVDTPPAPYQSDYESTWQSIQQDTGTARRLVRMFLPKWVRDFIWKNFTSGQHKKMDVPELGRINTAHFRKISI